LLAWFVERADRSPPPELRVGVICPYIVTTVTSAV